MTAKPGPVREWVVDAVVAAALAAFALSNAFVTDPSVGFDYPRSNYDANNPPVAAHDVGFTFSITGGIPTVPRTLFTWSIGSGQIPLAYQDLGAFGGFATAVFAYSSPRQQSLIFTSITGGNEVLQADPSVLVSTTTGVLYYR